MQGLHGIKKCACEFEVWGASINAPHFTNTVDVGFGPETIAYNLSGAGPDNVEFVPDLWPRQVGRQWHMHAAKVPSSYPYRACSTRPAISSALDGGDGSWDVDLGIISEHDENAGVDFVTSWKRIYSTRVVYVDGKQAFVTYKLTGDSLGLSGYEPLPDDYPTTNGAARGNHHILDIDRMEEVGMFRMFQAIDSLKTISEASQMELEYDGIIPPTVFNSDGQLGGTAISGQNAATCEYFGRDFYICSSYHPDILSGGSWGVARVKYEGASGMEVFASDSQLGREFYNNDPQEGAVTLENDHVIMLPSVRAYIDSEADQPDECWVCAKTLQFDESGGPDPELVTGRWLERVFRPGIGDEDVDTGVADGTLSATEIENVILPTAQTNSDFPDEEWDDLQVRCYNRKDGKDLLIFTCAGTPSLASPLADFENDDLNNGMPEDAQFSETGAPPGNGWIPDNVDPHGGTWSAKSISNALFEGVSDLTITVQVRTNSSELSFWYRLDNRARAAEFPHQLLNQPIVENRLQYWMDGVLIQEWDNQDFNEESEFLAWYEFTHTGITAGSHTFRWTLHREIQTQAGDLYANLDDIQFPELMLGDSIQGRKRYYYDGTQVRRAQYWDWAQRDKEDHVDLDGRVSTEPDFITSDYEGRILYGSPHAMVRILPDGSLDESFGDKGYIRFTASPNITAPEHPCFDPELPVQAVDGVDDPKWGSVQILPTHRGYQIRGVNAAMRDATLHPIPLEQWPAELFKDRLNSNGRWTMRPSCWTISMDGKQLVPHLEVLWRPTWDSPAWPEAPPYPVPPYRTGFATSDNTDAFGQYRPRDEHFLPEHSDKPRWSSSNVIIARTYCDGFSRFPQQVWGRYTDRDPPNDPEDPNYWHPDWPPGSDPLAQGAWPSALWKMCHAYYCPAGFWIIAFTLGVATVELCPDEEQDPVFASVPARGWYQGTRSYGLTDFDVVDCGCDCCIENPN